MVLKISARTMYEMKKRQQGFFTSEESFRRRGRLAVQERVHVLLWIPHSFVIIWSSNTSRNVRCRHPSSHTHVECLQNFTLHFSRCKIEYFAATHVYKTNGRYIDYTWHLLLAFVVTPRTGRGRAPPDSWRGRYVYRSTGVAWVYVEYNPSQVGCWLQESALGCVRFWSVCCEPSAECFFVYVWN